MKKIKLLIAVCSNIPAFLFSQDYSDVAVIVNDNSSESIAIAAYFQNARNIPEQNIIHISCPNVEEIDSVQFASIRSQIESYLLAQNLVDEMNYLVTTKGIPHKVRRTEDVISTSPNNTGKFTSVDSELTLLFSDESIEILEDGALDNPFYSEEITDLSTAEFSRDAYGVYLVTRLSGYTVADVEELIDRSGPDTPVFIESSNILLQISGIDNEDLLMYWTSIYNPLNEDLLDAGWNSAIDSDIETQIGVEDLIAFAGVIYDTPGDLPHTFLPGSLGSLKYFDSAETFDPTVQVNGTPQIADLIAGGVTGAQGIAYIQFASISLKDPLAFQRYFNSDAEYNLAESFYSAMPKISYQSVIIGDPKTSIQISMLNGIDDRELERTVTVFPNPARGRFAITSKSNQIYGLRILNALGALVNKDSYQVSGGPASLEIDMYGQNAGIYYLHLSTDQGDLVKKLVLY